MCQIDISNQIDNSWNKHSVMALAGKGIKFAVKINSSDKRRIRKSFRKIMTERDIACWIHAFLIFVCWRKNKAVNKLEICPDCRPTAKVYDYIQRIAKVCGSPDFKNNERSFYLSLLMAAITIISLMHGIFHRNNKRVVEISKIRDKLILEKNKE